MILMVFSTLRETTKRSTKLLRLPVLLRLLVKQIRMAMVKKASQKVVGRTVMKMGQTETMQASIQIHLINTPRSSLYGQQIHSMVPFQPRTPVKMAANHNHKAAKAMMVMIRGGTPVRRSLARKEMHSKVLL